MERELELVSIVFILLDGFRHDYLSEHDTPFLHRLSLSGNALLSRTREPFGFQSRPAFLAGLYPEESGVCTLFKYSPDTSPFRRIGPLARLGNVPKLGVWLRRMVELRTSRLSKPIYRYLHTTAQVPLVLLPHFDYSEKSLPWEASFRTPTLFDLIKRSRGEFMYAGWPLYSSPYADGAVVSRVCESLSRTHRLVFVQLGLLDGVGHRYGPHSVQTRKALSRTDSRVEEMFSILQERLSDFALFIFGDHGMVKVKKRLPIWSELRRLGWRLGRDYLVFLDSTTARFWFFKEDCREPIEDLLKGVGGGKLLDEADRLTHRIRFEDRAYGDMIFLADPGNLIHPSFFSTAEESPKGMHGYDPDCSENQGIFILLSRNLGGVKAPEVVDLVDIYPTAVNLLGSQMPEATRGRNLLETGA